MPSSDYSNAVGGGLKLKGTGGITKDKKKHKSSKKKAGKPAIEEARQIAAAADNDDAAATDTQLQKALAEEDEGVAQPREDPLQREEKELSKTETQRRFEERRKKRLDERLQREGVLTHKERVQRLNAYLSGLSEHNDMPRIGPG